MSMRYMLRPLPQLFLKLTPCSPILHHQSDENLLVDLVLSIPVFEQYYSWPLLPRYMSVSSLSENIYRWRCWGRIDSTHLTQSWRRVGGSQEVVGGSWFDLGVSGMAKQEPVLLDSRILWTTSEPWFPLLRSFYCQLRWLR